MDCKVTLVMCLCLTSMYGAPVTQQLMPLQYWMQPQPPLLQLQNPFFKRTVNNFRPPFMYPQQPVIILLPNVLPTSDADDRYFNVNEENANIRLKNHMGYTDEHNDAVVLDSEPNPAEFDPQKAVPINPRFFIGQIISYIPFLPIEINVPDAIGWIISHWPGWLGGSAQTTGNTTRLSSKGPIPIIVMPEQIMSAI